MPTLVERIGREHVETFIEDQLARWKPPTAAVRFRSLQQLFIWLVEEREITSSPMINMKLPTVPEAPVEVVPDDVFRRLLKVCEGREFPELRDTAILRLMFDTGARLQELAGLQLEDVDLDVEAIQVLGKGSRVRVIPLGRKAGVALDRYIRVRHRHPMATTNSALWLGTRGVMTGSGISQMLQRRCAQAEIPTINPHRFRHTAADAWLEAGGSEGDAMRLFGWKSRDMLARYGASRADRRAQEAFRHLRPGDRV